MKMFPPTPMEDTNLFYTETSDINHNYIRNIYRANTETTKSVQWNPVLTETNDGEPFISEYKQVESIELNNNITNLDSQVQTNSTDNNKEASLGNQPLKTGTVIERNEFLYLE